ncbi:MAG TPA: hypothetical protein PK308_00145 [Phycisphaerales bacterium]|nr:hypothetical protein [Phycisphaerales bacterium]
MSPDSHSDPTPVMKFVAGVLLFLTISALVALLIWKGTAITWPVIAALGVPCFGLLIMLFDSVREKVLDVASWLPFVKYQKPEGGS